VCFLQLVVADQLNGIQGWFPVVSEMSFFARHGLLLILREFDYS
jgi:hypothetical protein